MKMGRYHMLILRGDDVKKLEIARQMIYDDLTFEGYVIEYRTTGH